MKSYRCTECTLMRCDAPGEVCEECNANAGDSAPVIMVSVPAAPTVAEYVWTWTSGSVE